MTPTWRFWGTVAFVAVALALLSAVRAWFERRRIRRTPTVGEQLLGAELRRRR